MSDAILTLRDVSLQRGARQILSALTLEVKRGERVALMGSSGSGKTSALRMVAGLQPFQSGRITVDTVALEAGATIPGATLRRLRRKVGMVFQFHCLFEHLSVIENVCLAPVHVYKTPAREAAARARALLSAFGVEHRADALPREISGGEAQRVAIARALAVDPPLLLMDEPTASLDAPRRAELGKLLRDLSSEGRTLVIATHDEEFARGVATRTLRLTDGALCPA